MSGQTQSEIIPGVFPHELRRLPRQMDMPTVPVGEAVYPVLTTNATVGTPAENAEQLPTRPAAFSG